MNTDVMFSSKTDLWETPQKFFDRLNDEFSFDLDVCALPENAKCDQYYTPEQDGLSQLWKGVCWCNPPYGREIGRWVKKAADSAEGGQWWLCCSQRGQIHGGFTTTYTERRRFGLYADA